MNYFPRFLFVILLGISIVFSQSLSAAHSQTPIPPSPQSALAIVKAAIDYWRDTASLIEAKMTVHRPSWERSSELRLWTKGTDLSLVRFTAPAKDAGNASLTVNDETWSFSPKINKVVKIPASMKSQSWMGSDFSYDDLSKEDSLVNNYTHRILRQETHDSKPVNVVEAIPLETAPVVWGKEILFVRDDHIMLRHEFYDQDMKLIKIILAKEIREIGGKLYATRTRVEKTEKPEDWTEVTTMSASFGLSIPDSMFTLSSLRNPRE